jgi:hypothetical protein
MLLTFDLAALAVSLPTASILAIRWAWWIHSKRMNGSGFHRPPKTRQQQVCDQGRMLHATALLHSQIPPPEKLLLHFPRLSSNFLGSALQKKERKRKKYKKQQSNQ